ncbi:MAG: hypothetical protein HON90_07160, partial [Halobacteriovoraceae bacterium]|nr:hypothetical protein [Halobacteriovoraceae bacterium]
MNKVLFISWIFTLSFAALSQVEDMAIDSELDLTIIDELLEDDVDISKLATEEEQIQEELESNFEAEPDSKQEEIKPVEITEEQLENIIPSEDDILLDSSSEDKPKPKAAKKINHQLIKEFSKYRQTNLSDLIKKKQKLAKKKYKFFELEALKIQLKDIAQSPIRTFNIARGTHLIRVSDNKLVYTPKTIKVHGHALLDFYKYRYLVDKKGQLSYKVYYHDTTDIKAITNLHRPPYQFIRLAKKEKIIVHDKNFGYSLKLNLHTGLSSPEYTKSLLGNPSQFAPLFRLESTVLSNKNFLFNSGLTFMYESISGKFISNGSYNISSFSLGPSFKYYSFYDKYGLIIQPRFSISSTAAYTKNDESYKVNLSETSLLVGLEKENTSKNGKFTLGYTFQRKWIRANTKDLL